MEARPLMVLAVGMVGLGLACGCASEGPASLSEPLVDPATAVTPATPATPGAVDAGDTSGSKERFDACTVDDDCVVVPRVGCCNNGWKEAVNRQRKTAYARSFTCPTERPICLLYIVQDMGVPHCKEETHRCVLVNPDGSAR